MVKRVNEKLNCINNIKHFFKIENDCKTENDIVQSICLGNQELELLTIKLLIDKMIYNKNFNLSIETYKKCKKECSDFLN